MMTIQHNITKILDQANTIHSKRQEAIKLSEAFRRSVFLEMFGDPVSNPKGWEIRKLSDLGLIVYGVPVGVFFNKLDYSSEGDILVVTLKNIQPFQFVTDALKFISREKLNTLKNRILPGDILLGTFGATIGNVCLFPSLFEKAVLSNGVGKITPDNQVINTIYLSDHLFLLKDEMMKQTLGSTLLKISTLKGLKISLPPLARQEKFAQIMQNVEIFRAHLEQSEQQGKHLLRSLTQK